MAEGFSSGTRVKTRCETRRACLVRVMLPKSPPLSSVRRPAARLLILGLALAVSSVGQTASPPLRVTALAGVSGSTGYADGPSASARFHNPSGVAVDRQGNVLVADTAYNTIRRIAPSGAVTTLAGQAVDPETGVANNGGLGDGVGVLAQFSLGKPLISQIGSNTLAIDGNDNVYVADTLNGTLRRVTPAGAVTTLSLRDASGNQAELRSPEAVAVDQALNLYVVESATNTIRKVTPAGVVSLFAGTPGVAGSADGGPGVAQFNYPRGIAVDSAGVVFVSDTNNNTIRRISPAGLVSTYAGSPGTPTKNSAGWSDGLGPNARFRGPVGLAVDAAGNLYVADTGNHLIRRITVDGVVSTVAGAGLAAGSADGTGNAVRLRQPLGVAVDRTGQVFFSDTGNHVVRRGVPEAAVPGLVIRSQPKIQIINTGQSATFSVVAEGPAGISYQWQRNGVAVAGATAVSHTTPAATLADDRTYFTVALTIGSTTFVSSPAQLQVYVPAVVIPPVVLLTQPSDQTVTAGLRATFKVEAGGSGALTYQWRKSGAPISGATSDEFSIASVHASDAGSYRVVVSAGASSVESNPADLLVTPAIQQAVTIFSQPASQSVPAGSAAGFSVLAGGTAPLSYQWQRNGVSISGATYHSLGFGSVQASDAGNYRVVITNPLGTVTSTEAVLSIGAATMVPAFSRHPSPVSAKAGEGATFSVSVTGAPPPVLQWQKDGVNIPGATASVFTISSVKDDDAGRYRVIASNAGGVVTSESVQLTVEAAPAVTARLVNLSILARVESGETMTLGAVLGGAGTAGAKALVARAAGPALGQLGVGGTLRDPAVKLDRVDGATAVVVAANNDWSGSAALAAAFAQVGAFPYASADSKDAGLYQPSLLPGNYTMQVNDSSGGSGTVIAELYDATPSTAFTGGTPRLINVSVLKQVPAGETLTAGFVVGGPAGASLNVLVRAVGPTLGQAPFSIGGVMADPALELFNNATGARINSNNDWGGATALNAAFGKVGAFALAGPATRDSVLLVSLSAGQYSARVSGADGGGGMVIVEVYEVP